MAIIVENVPVARNTSATTPVAISAVVGVPPLFTRAAAGAPACRAGSPDAAVDLIDQNFFGGEMPLVTRTALLTYIKGGTFNDTRVRETIGLAVSANAFQWY